MKVLCLMPTYGRRKALLENSIQLFLNQDYPDKTLLIYDDLGTLAMTEGDIPNVMVMSTIKRANSVGAKYNTMMNYSSGYDAIIVWDDDDTYCPHHITTHVQILQNFLWSKPSKIISAYHSPPREEQAAGRFHGSIAIHMGLLKHMEEKTGSMWIDTRRATFDQEFLQKLQLSAPAGDPCTIRPPSYVYRWQTSGGGHCSGLMGDEEWYIKYQPDSREPIDRLEPKLDEDSTRLLQQLCLQC
jgi:hypothetical protein